MNASSSYVGWHAILCVPIETEETMRELRSEVIGDRRVALVEDDSGRYDVTIAVRTMGRDWEDISLRADAALAFDIASRRYHQRVVEQQARRLGWKV